MADIVLIQPRGNRFDEIAIRVPNGLLAIAALPEQAGYSVKIVDLRVDSDWRQSLKDAIDSDTLCVGIRCFTGRMIVSALEIAKEVRLVNPSIPLVWGGPHPTLMPKQTLESPLVDIIIINEGDKVFFELVGSLAEKRALSEIKGIGYKINGEIKINSPAPLIDNLNSLPLFPYKLVDVPKYSSLSIDNLPSLDIITSRGCPYNCGFCSTPITSKRLWRASSVEKIIENILFLKGEYGITTFYLVDDNFMVDLDRVELFLDALKEAKLKIYWGTQGVRVDTINRMSSKFLDKIEDSGCVELSIGIESANSEILDMIDKKFKREDVLSANEKLAGRNFAVKYNMIIGFPGETLNGINETVKLAIDLQKKNKNAWFPFNIFTPFPSTQMFQKAVNMGFTQPANLEEWAHLESTGWGKYYKHWMSDRENKILESINCTSYLAFSSGIHRVSNRILKMMLQAYQPLAYWRFKHTFYFMHLEKYFIQKLDS